MNLPPEFIKTIHGTFGGDGREMLARLPDLIALASNQWGLSNVQPVPNLSYNFVAYAKQGKGDVVLKIGVPRDELASEMAALRLFNGDGACHLLDSDEAKGMFLLERLKPGTMLSELDDDDERTRIAMDVLQNLIFHRDEVPARLHDNFIQLTDWFDGLKKIRPRFDGGTGPFPRELLERVESFLPELFGVGDIRLMHGDFHHFNILRSERGWLAIDPKGVIGPVGYEIGPLMINPWVKPMDRNRLAMSKIEGIKVQTERRVAIIHERLGWDREHIIQWSLAHAVLSAWWDIEDDMDWEYPLQCAKVFSELK